MKVLALGGCGEMGRAAVKTLLALSPEISVIIADRNAEAAKSFSETLSGRASWLALDIRDQKALDQAVQGADLTMSSVGPYFLFGKLVLSSCIRCRRHYVDICDDWEPTLEMLDADQAAKDAGITAIIGMGASPGMTNLAGRVAIEALDRADSIVTAWDLESARPEKVGKKASAATVHGFHQLTGTIRQFKAGRYTDVRPIEPRKIAYPGADERVAWTIGHPESVTFPRFFPKLTESVNVFTAGSALVWGLKLVAGLADWKLISIERAAWIAERVEGPPKGVQDWSAQRETMLKKGGLPPLFALAEGEKDGARAQAACMILSAPPGGMAGATGMPMAVGAFLVLTGKITAPGVFAPEGAVNPKDFFDILAPLCSPPMKDADDFLLVTRSWEKPDLAALLKERIPH
ncbi:MAG: saccharopine dehydrogenase NADP-binding domain-containing protein [Thermodesulfobacteriota bacterium]